MERERGSDTSQSNLRVPPCRDAGVLSDLMKLVDSHSTDFPNCHSNPAPSSVSPPPPQVGHNRASRLSEHPHQSWSGQQVRSGRIIFSPSLITTSEGLKQEILFEVPFNLLPVWAPETSDLAVGLRKLEIPVWARTQPGGPLSWPKVLRFPAAVQWCRICPPVPFPAFRKGGNA